MNNKMSWLSDKIINGTQKYIISDTNRTHGAISCPTGYGKSGIIFTDMFHHIINSFTNQEKIIINLTTPIIKLCEQQGVDFLNFLNGVISSHKYNINSNNIAVFINNSGDANKMFSTINNYDVYNFLNIEDEFIYNSQYNVAIVISCNKSLYKFIRKFDKKQYLNIKIITYIDEAHTISIDNSEDNCTERVDLHKLCKICNYCYLISATNKRELVQIVNSYNSPVDNDDTYIYNVSPNQAITENIICAPIIGFTSTETGKITANICKQFMTQVKNINPNIIHKILVTCDTTTQLNKLRTELKESGYTVFSTCSENGTISEEYHDESIEYFENTNKMYNDVNDFIAGINNCQTDCFVIHIRQMISGIDVNSLTDAIIAKSNTDNFNSYDTVIQIIGRTLRLGNERDIDINNRKKQYSNILFVTPETNDNCNNNISEFVIRYYGINNLMFTKDFSTNEIDKSNTAQINLFTSINLIKPKDSYLYNELMLKIKEYIKTYMVSQKVLFESLGAIDTFINDNFKIIEEKYINIDFNNVYITKFNYDEELKNDIFKLFKEFNIIKN